MSSDEAVRELGQRQAEISRVTDSIPDYPNEETRRLSEELDKARTRRSALQQASMDTAAVDQDILALRRAIREGGQLPAGDSLGDGRYLLVKSLGRGGFGTVWKALDKTTAEHVAIKVLHPNLAGDPQRKERFFRGARVMVELGHPSIVRVREAKAEDGGFCYFVMDLIEGCSLREAILERKLDRASIIAIVLQIGDALAAAHARRYVHRDVKPENILIDAAGKPYLTDFDLVGGVETTGGTKTGAMGSFYYAAPEVMTRPQEADARADVYSLGMTLVFAFSGAPLPPEILGGNAPRFVDGLDCPVALKKVLRNAVSYDVKLRHADAGVFCKALGEAARPTEAFSGRTRKRLVTVQHASAGLILLAAATGSIWFVSSKGTGLICGNPPVVFPLNHVCPDRPIPLPSSIPEPSVGSEARVLSSIPPDSSVDEKEPIRKYCDEKPSEVERDPGAAGIALSDNHLFWTNPRTGKVWAIEKRKPNKRVLVAERCDLLDKWGHIPK
jgi:serine/threonine protein kinase